MKRKYDALIQSYQDWLSRQRARYEWFEGETEVCDEIERLRRVQDEQREAA